MDIARRLPSLPAPPWQITTGRAHSWNPLRDVRAADVLLALGLTAAFSEPGFDPYHHYSGTLWGAIGPLGAAALAWRLVSPRWVWLIATAASTWVLVMRHGPDWGGLSPLMLIPAPLVALYTLASLTTRTTGQVAMAISAIALEAGLLSHPTQLEAVATTAALILAAWAVGDGARARREGVTALGDRARALEAERSQRDLLAAAEERARIARELHDIVAHHVSVISLQAGTARLLAESGAPPDAALLAGIETASRQAMTELRQALGVIRHTPGGAEPLPGLARLPELATGLAAGSGLAVTIRGDAGPLPAAVDLTAYRIVQEGLTNVLRHSGAQAVQVTLRQEHGVLYVTVTDDGPGRARPPAQQQEGGGHGLAGLRERVAALGGTFRAGPRAGTGFEVHAELPIQDALPDRGLGG